MNAIELILSDSRGVYIPRDFICNDYNEIDADHCAAWGLTEENKEHWICAANPEDEWYWEAWSWILDNAKYTDENGNVYRLWQDGDLWAYCFEKMTSEEQNFGFGEE